MQISKEQYKQLYQKHSPPSPSFKTVPRAFCIGGLICALGQVLMTLYTRAGLEQAQASGGVSCTLIALGVILTAVRVFEHVAKFAGAGTLVPITGFANAIASPAIDCKAEGWVLGVGAKIFTVAGPVLLYGTLAGAIYGVIYYFADMAFSL